MSHHPHGGEREQIAAIGQRIINGLETIMATAQQLLDDITTYINDVTAYIAARDAADVDLKAQLAAALAAQGGAATQDQVDAAFAAIEAARPAVEPPTPPATPAAPASA